MSLDVSRIEMSAQMEAILAHGVWHPRDFDEALEQLVSLIVARLDRRDERLVTHIEAFVRHNAELLLCFQVPPEVVADRLSTAWHRAALGPYRLAGVLTGADAKAPRNRLVHSG